MTPSDPGGGGSLLSHRRRFGRRERVERPVDVRLLHPASTPAERVTQHSRGGGMVTDLTASAVVNGEGMTP